MHFLFACTHVVRFPVHQLRHDSTNSHERVSGSVNAALFIKYVVLVLAIFFYISVGHFPIELRIAIPTESMVNPKP